MKFKVWESKLCDRMNSWYKATEKDGQELVSINETLKADLPGMIFAYDQLSYVIFISTHCYVIEKL